MIVSFVSSSSLARGKWKSVRTVTFYCVRKPKPKVDIIQSSVTMYMYIHIRTSDYTVTLGFIFHMRDIHKVIIVQKAPGNARNPFHNCASTGCEQNWFDFQEGRSYRTSTKLSNLRILSYRVINCYYKTTKQTRGKNSFRFLVTSEFTIISTSWYW